MTDPSTDRIFEIRYNNPGDGRPMSLGAKRTYEEAAEKLDGHLESLRSRGHKATEYRIEEIDTTGLFQFPPLPVPRERFTVKVDESREPGTWTTTRVRVFDGPNQIAEYERNYGMLQTFEPFRQRDRHFALISTDYTATSVMDLATGEIVASETPDSNGFCPVGFYVPDWWDLSDGTVLPGSLWWRSEDHEWPSGDFGFVWGCIWGDDSSWKVQYLDLSGVADGVIHREERFGYVRLATHAELKPKQFIRLSSFEGRRRVEFDIEQAFDLATGEPSDD